VIFRRTERFLEAFRVLPVNIQSKTLKALALFGQNQRHPSLEVKKLQGRDGIWEARVNQKYRFTVHYEKDTSGETICVLRNVDNHDECLKNP
jgi:plasmid maintenance system killer protein